MGGIGSCRFRISALLQPVVQSSTLTIHTLSAGKYDLVSQLLAAKEASGKTFTQISKELGLTNAFTAQLFHNQVHTSCHNNRDCSCVKEKDAKAKNAKRDQNVKKLVKQQIVVGFGR